MPVFVTRFKTDHKSIAGFLLSRQLRDPVRQGAEDVAAEANRTKVTQKLDYYVESGPDVIMTRNGNPRLSERVRSDHPASAAIEFGSGKDENGRPQGGRNDAYRTLGKAGAKFNDAMGE